MHVAVVTFSSDTVLVRAVLSLAFGAAASAKIMLRGHDDSWVVPPFASLPASWHYVPRKMKVEHLLSVVGQLRKQHGESVKPGEVLLLDDDALNVHAAQAAGVRAALLPPDSSSVGGATGEEALLRTLQLHLLEGEKLPRVEKRRAGHAGDIASVCALL